ncbi:hypothetical protein C3747_60g46 [Trypanosoma cruzi]|uniref:Uncharacterized protein n=2 Tax=Trypanosoma cruzi TaxID=5693 RepID=Q4DML7_TRYCC|nr:hypothetical protein, conserved [Trypanosoma cruzi]EAN93760.1 hypothetical protein, conserved [Trypanosoma cruzi]PWV11350.1 hypothetical protein C3747_60g46 [Trypanosoma cruzi]RNC44034.1 hypothetical protein TcCL_NonESM06260 [Trypanosoma cruzi]|eukprot:XP_815611.1 hypothetical protein [Trypanosoma cruzi strain CL Brener]
MRPSRLWLLQWGHAAVAGTVIPPKRKRQFVMKEGQNSHHGSDVNRHSQKHVSSASFRPPINLTHELSQREQYRLHQEQEGAEMCRRSVPGEWLSPIPKRYRLYDGIDEHGYEAARVSKEDRRKMLQAALERNAASVVEYTEGGEENIDLGGMSAGEYHGQTDSMTIPRDSALYNAVLAREELDSRKRNNTWTMARKRQQSGGIDIMGKGEDKLMSGGDGTQVIDDKRRRRRQDEGSYTSVFDENLLEPNYESIGQPRSTYGMRKMLVAGLTSYQAVITREEEAIISDELLQLLQDTRAAYIAEETRYCVNLYEKELGIPGKDTLAFAMSRAPTLQRVLGRFFHLGLIPSLPNICQVSEMIGNFSGYPIHKKPATIGPYVGILNLVSTTLMYLQHLDNPWFPRLHMSPRSLSVIEQPCLGDYKMGYKWTHQPFHTFEYGTRISKDYRIEVMFATVEVAQMRYLDDAVRLTEYAVKKQQEEGAADKRRLLPPLPSPDTLSEGANEFRGSTVKWLDRLNRQMHASERGARSGEAGTAIDGNALREQLLASGCIGAKSRTLETSVQAAVSTDDANEKGKEKFSPTQRRMAALKARYEFAKRLKESKPQVGLGGGVHVIEGHSPRKRDSS